MLIVVGPFDRLEWLDQRSRKNLVDMIDGHNLEPFLNCRRKLGDVLLVLRRDENGRDAAAKRREQLLL